jgi:hypothetical protein
MGRPSATSPRVVAGLDLRETPAHDEAVRYLPHTCRWVSACTKKQLESYLSANLLCLYRHLLLLQLKDSLTDHIHFGNLLVNCMERRLH